MTNVLLPRLSVKVKEYSVILVTSKSNVFAVPNLKPSIKKYPSWFSVVILYIRFVVLSFESFGNSWIVMPTETSSKTVKVTFDDKTKKKKSNESK